MHDLILFLLHHASLVHFLLCLEFLSRKKFHIYPMLLRSEPNGRIEWLDGLWLKEDNTTHETTGERQVMVKEPT